jgi:hypothetical protein
MTTGGIERSPNELSALTLLGTDCSPGVAHPDCARETAGGDK